MSQIEQFSAIISKLLAAVAPAALALVPESSDAVAATGAFTVTLHPGGRSHAG